MSVPSASLFYIYSIANLVKKEGMTKVSMKRFVLFLCGNRKMCVSLCQSKRGRQTYRTGSTGILINNLHETEDKFHLLMAGHAPQGVPRGRWITKAVNTQNLLVRSFITSPVRFL